MRHEASSHPPGTVVVASDHLGRYIDFEICLERLRAPVGTVMVRPRSGSCAFNCNNGVRNRRGEWVFFIDDDQTFEPDILLRLLDRRVDAVAALVPMRYPPFELVLYKQLDFPKAEDGTYGFVCDYFRAADLGTTTGLLEVAGLPKSGGLFREPIWKALSDPWFKIGRIRVDEIDDDRLFMYEVRQAGFQLWADLDQVSQHLTTVGIDFVRGPDGQFVRQGVIAGRRVGLTV